MSFKVVYLLSHHCLLLHLFIVLFIMAKFLLLPLLGRELGLPLCAFYNWYYNFLKFTLLQTLRNQMQLRIILFLLRFTFQLFILSTPLIISSLASWWCFDFLLFITPWPSTYLIIVCYYSLLLSLNYFCLHELIINFLIVENLFIYLLFQHSP